MNDVTVQRTKLLKTLKDNRAAHVQLFNDALDGYKNSAIEKLEATIKKIENGGTPEVVNLNVPRSHEEEYDDAIQMLEMSVDKEITLHRHEFANYVQDKWVSIAEKQMLRGLALSSANAAAYMGDM